MVEIVMSGKQCNGVVSVIEWKPTYFFPYYKAFTLANLVTTVTVVILLG
jgi:hypothetical protein